MNNQRSLADKTLVLVGAGHSNIALIRQFMMDPIVGVRLIVVSPQSVSPYSGMLPGFLAGHYQLDELFVDVAALCKRAGARFIRGSLATIDAQQKTIWIQHGAFSDAKPLAVHYDYAVLNTGAAPANSFPSTHPHCYYVKPIHELLSALPMIDKALEGHEKSLVIAGGGAAGLELAFAFRARYHPSTKISLVAKHRLERDAALQSGASLIRKALKKRSIHLLEEISVDEALEQSVALSNGENIDADVICAATPVNPPDWIEESGLPTEKGFLKVNSYLQLQGCHGLYAAGDIVHMNTPRGRSGVMAVRAGQYLADALWRQLAQRPVVRFRPQKHWLTLLNLGDGQAIGVKGAFRYQSRGLFHLKDWIDRGFLNRFKPPIMQTKGPMRCEGCAAKLPGSTLESAFGHQFEDAAVTQGDGLMRVSSIDALSYLVDDPYLVGALTMRHAVSDIWAMAGKTPQALTLIAVERASTKALEANEFSQVLRGLQDAAQAYGVIINGGHSLALDQPMVAVSIEGICSNVVTKDGAQIGDEVWVTGPLGSGILFAALARGEPIGQSIDEWTMDALKCLLEASQAASKHQVSAMTDVTGFGLAGHLKEMLNVSNVSFEWAESIESFTGVDRLIEKDIRSSAHHDNELYAGRIGVGAPSPVVFDPQTCGPLMIAAPSQIADRVVNDWKKLGLRPQYIGRVAT